MASSSSRRGLSVVGGGVLFASAIFEHRRQDLYGENEVKGGDQEQDRRGSGSSLRHLRSFPGIGIQSVA